MEELLLSLAILLTNTAGLDSRKLLSCNPQGKTPITLAQSCRECHVRANHPLQGGAQMSSQRRLLQSWSCGVRHPALAQSCTYDGVMCLLHYLFIAIIYKAPISPAAACSLRGLEMKANNISTHPAQTGRQLSNPFLTLKTGILWGII